MYILSFKSTPQNIPIILFKIISWRNFGDLCEFKLTRQKTVCTGEVLECDYWQKKREAQRELVLVRKAKARMTKLPSCFGTVPCVGRSNNYTPIETIYYVACALLSSSDTVQWVYVCMGGSYNIKYRLQLTIDCNLTQLKQNHSKVSGRGIHR